MFIFFFDVCFVFERAERVTYVESHELKILIFYIPLTIDQTEMDHVSASLVLPNISVWRF